MKLVKINSTSQKYFFTQCLRLQNTPSKHETFDDEFNFLLKTIGILITSKRIEAGLKQCNLAHVCHINASSLSRLERGHREVNLRNLYYIIYSLNMDLDVFFDEVCRIKRAFKKIEKH